MRISMARGDVYSFSFAVFIDDPQMKEVAMPLLQELQARLPELFDDIEVVEE